MRTVTFPRPGTTTSISIVQPDGSRRQAAIAAQPADYAAEWGFVLQHARTIDRYCAKLATDPRISADELRSEATEWIVRLHGSFDPKRASASTWLYLMVRRARQALLVTANRRDAWEVVTDFDVEHFDANRRQQVSVARMTTDHGLNVAQIERRITLGQVLEHTSDLGRAACMTILGDLDPRQIDEAIGLTRAQRDARVYDIAYL